MPGARVSDLDYLAARVHGRRSRLAEGERLDGLCHLRTIPELTRAVFPDAEFQTCTEFQRRALKDLLRELSNIARSLDGAGSALLAWMLVRFQVENIKVLLRGFLNHSPLEVVREHFVSLPGTLALDAQALLAAEGLEDFVGRLPKGVLHKALRAALGTYRNQLRPFFFEAALDRGYFQELLDRAGQLSGEDKDLVVPIVDQEVNTFQLMLVVRGRFSYGLAPELLFPLHVRWSGIPTERFNTMLAASDVRTAATFALGRAIDALPPENDSNQASGAVDSAALEALAWRRFLRLSNRAFRRSHMGLGAIIGYAGIRRVEVANLITLSEGIRTGVAPDLIRARLIPRCEQEVAYV
jgi:V/A-type H+-transporting ATPase subunit C